jgi:protein-disulfide isomerase
MHDFIFDNQDQLRADSIRTQLDQRVKTLAGLDFPAYATCMDNHSSLELIHRDLSIGEIAGVDATPTIFVNGYRLSGSSREQLLTLYPTA